MSKTTLIQLLNINKLKETQFSKYFKANVSKDNKDTNNIKLHVYTIPPAIIPPPNLYGTDSDVNIASSPTIIAQTDTHAVTIAHLDIINNRFSLMMAKSSVMKSIIYILY